MEKIGKKPFYSEPLKRTVLHRMSAEGIGFGEVSRLYGIGGSCTVRQWAKKMGTLPKTGQTNMPDQPKEVAAERKKKRQFRQRTEDQRRIAELGAQLLEARQRVQLYALALEVAGRDKGGDVLKKLAGGRPDGGRGRMGKHRPRLPAPGPQQTGVAQGTEQGTRPVAAQQWAKRNGCAGKSGRCPSRTSADGREKKPPDTARQRQRHRAGDIPLRPGHAILFTAHGRHRPLRARFGEHDSPYENAVAERVNGIFKQELGLDQTFTGLDHAQRTMAKAAQLYNDKRLHWSCTC